MSMIRTSLLALASVLLIATSALAASEADYKAALRRRRSRQQAGRRRAQSMDHDGVDLNAAKKFAEAGDFDKAVASAKEAEALAKASIFQATSEKKLWKDMEIR